MDDTIISYINLTLSTQELCALELCDLTPVDTSWSAFNYYLHNACSQYCPVYPGGHTQLVLLLLMQEPPFTQKQAGLESMENRA